MLLSVTRLWLTIKWKMSVILNCLTAWLFELKTSTITFIHRIILETKATSSENTFLAMAQLPKVTLWLTLGSDRTWITASPTSVYSLTSDRKNKNKMWTELLNLVTGCCIITLAASCYRGWQFTSCKQVTPLTSYANFFTLHSSRPLLFCLIPTGTGSQLRCMGYLSVPMDHRMRVM